MLKLEDKSLQISLSAPRFDWRMVVEPARFDLIYTCCCIFCSVPGKMRRVEKLFSGRWCFFGRRPRRWTSTSCCSKGSCTNYVNGQDSSRQSTIDVQKQFLKEEGEKRSSVPPSKIDFSWLLDHPELSLAVHNDMFAISQKTLSMSSNVLSVSSLYWSIRWSSSAGIAEKWCALSARMDMETLHWMTRLTSATGTPGKSAPVLAVGKASSMNYMRAKVGILEKCLVDKLFFESIYCKSHKIWHGI